MNFISILSVVIVLIQLTNYYFYGAGKLHISYPLTATAMVGYIVIETHLGLRDPSQKGILLFNLVNVFALVNALRGWYRLKNTKI